MSKQSSDFSETVPPSSVSVDSHVSRKPVLHLPDGRVLVQQIGFRPLVASKPDPNRRTA